MQSGTQAQIPKGEFRKKSTALVLPITFQQFMLAIVSATYLICGFSQIYLCIMKNSNLAAKTMHISCATATAIARLAELLWIICELSKKRPDQSPASLHAPSGQVPAKRLLVYCIINLDEIVKLPAVYRHYKKYIWLKDLTDH